MDLVLFLTTLQKISATAVSIIRLVDNFAGHQPLHIKERLARSLELMSEYMLEKHQSETWRNDWFSENQVSNHRIPRRLLEKTIKEIINDSEERKSKYIAKFWVNICLTSNSDIDEATAFAYLETIESLSWRQLCIIRLGILLENQEVDIRSVDDIEQMPQDEQTSFYSIGRDIEKLMDNHYIQSVGIPRSEENNKPFVHIPIIARLPDYTRRLHSLMNLDEIPIEDIVKTFSPWKVRQRKSEEGHEN